MCVPGAAAGAARGGGDPMSHRTRTAEPPDLAGLSLEEVLQRAHARCTLLADLFALHAVAPDDAQTEALSPAACTALAGPCAKR